MPRRRRSVILRGKAGVRSRSTDPTVRSATRTRSSPPRTRSRRGTSGTELAQAAKFVDWRAWSITDEDKGAIAGSVASVRAGTDERFLREARFAAEAAIEAPSRPTCCERRRRPRGGPRGSGPDLDAWNRDVGNDLRAAYEEAMLALGAGTAIGKGYRNFLAELMLPVFFLSTRSVIPLEIASHSHGKATRLDRSRLLAALAPVSIDVLTARHGSCTKEQLDSW